MIKRYSDVVPSYKNETYSKIKGIPADCVNDPIMEPLEPSVIEIDLGEVELDFTSEEISSILDMFYMDHESIPTLEFKRMFTPVKLDAENALKYSEDVLDDLVENGYDENDMINYIFHHIYASIFDGDIRSTIKINESIYNANRENWPEYEKSIVEFFEEIGYEIKFEHVDYEYEGQERRYVLCFVFWMPVEDEE